MRRPSLVKVRALAVPVTVAVPIAVEVAIPVEVDPGLLCCKPHWFMIPKPLRQRVWKAYRKGQEVTKDPTPEYLAAAKAAIAAVAERDARQGALL